MFSGRQQLARVCQALCRGIDSRQLWSLAGPSPRARELFERAPFDLAGGPRVRLELAFCLWEGGKGPALGSALELLDRTELHMVGTLLMAMSQDAPAIDAWVRRNGGVVGDA